jgi:hypothetical protein
LEGLKSGKTDADTGAEKGNYYIWTPPVSEPVDIPHPNGRLRRSAESKKGVWPSALIFEESENDSQNIDELGLSHISLISPSSAATLEKNLKKHFETDDYISVSEIAGLQRSEGRGKDDEDEERRGDGDGNGNGGGGGGGGGGSSVRKKKKRKPEADA